MMNSDVFFGPQGSGLFLMHARVHAADSLDARIYSSFHAHETQCHVSNFRMECLQRVGTQLANCVPILSIFGSVASLS